MSSRRNWFSQTANNAVVVIAGALSVSPDACANDELPSIIRGYTVLAPLGKPETTSQKTTGLSLVDLASRLTRDLTDGATGQGGYFLSGDLSTDIFQDDCEFVDPTNRVSSLSRYQKALRILFDPSQSIVQLVTPLTINEEERTISGRLRSRGYLQLPWRPYVKAYETDIVYSVDESSGLINKQAQTWTKSASQALQETFTPNVVEPPPKSNRKPSSAEPAEVTRLFEYVNGRRPNEYTEQEQQEMDASMDTIASSQSPFERNLLLGTWMLVYLQPGPEGGGIDRRIPFPELPFNQNYQKFGSDVVENIGQVMGPWVDVRVSGELHEENPTTMASPKRFQADIQRGELCVQRIYCAPLPIEGQGLFDSVYVGERLRIGQNINGGRARVVQIRLDEGVVV
jgi:hypothetical protein